MRSRAREADYIGFQVEENRPAILTGLGFFAEALSLQCLELAAERIRAPAEREHVTLGIYMQPDRFNVRYLPVPECCKRQDLRFTLDTPQDLEVLREIFAALGSHALLATPEEIVSLVDKHPQWIETMRRSNEENPKGAGYLKE